MRSSESLCAFARQGRAQMRIARSSSAGRMGLLLGRIGTPLAPKDLSPTTSGTLCAYCMAFSCPSSEERVEEHTANVQAQASRRRC